jgi:hypothetical protein
VRRRVRGRGSGEGERGGEPGDRYEEVDEEAVAGVQRVGEGDATLPSRPRVRMGPEIGTAIRFVRTPTVGTSSKVAATIGAVET